MEKSRQMGTPLKVAQAPRLRIPPQKKFASIRAIRVKPFFSSFAFSWRGESRSEREKTAAPLR
jgi:hypothetical protein